MDKYWKDTDRGNWVADDSLVELKESVKIFGVFISFFSLSLWHPAHPDDITFHADNIVRTGCLVDSQDKQAVENIWKKEETLKVLHASPYWKLIYGGVHHTLCEVFLTIIL